MKVYIVTSGWYSDYRIEAVFSTKKRAKEHIEKYGKDDISDINDEPDEWIVDDNVYNKIIKIKEDKNIEVYSVIITKEGQIQYIRKEKKELFYLEGAIGKRKYFDSRQNLHMTILAKSKEHAVKIANDRRTQLIAMNKWIK